MDKVATNPKGLDTTLVAQMLRLRWYIYGILCLGYFLVYFHRVSTAVVAPELTEAFGLTAASLGLLSSAYFYPYALAQIPSGILTDYLGPRKTVTFFILVAAIGAFLFGTASTYSWAIVGRSLVGLGVAFIYIPVMKILAEWFRQHEFATLTGLLLSVGNIGALSAAAPLSLLVGAAGWRNSFIYIGAVTVILAIGCWLIIRNKPQDMGLPTVYDIDGSAPPAGSTDSLTLKESMKLIVSNRNFWLLSLWYFVFYGTVMGFQGLWATPYLIDTQSLAKPAAIQILTYIALGMICGCPLSGYLSDRVLHSRKKVLIIGTVLYTFSWLLLIVISNSQPAFIPYLFFAMGFFGGFFVVIYAWFKELMPSKIVGTAIGAMNFFPFVGGAIFQQIMGSIIGSYQRINGAYPLDAYINSFWFCFASLAIVTIAIPFASENQSLKRKA
ncbi:MAG: major facilitator superfamily 1 [Firmicutes bacterium]|nr:major facilitator superfamily 1 [Bacillota bacterium]